MAYNELLAERIREHLATTEDLAQLREQKMFGWLSVEADAAKTARDLARWIARSRAYVETLPPK